MQKIELQWTPLTPLTEVLIKSLGSGISGVYRLSYRHDANSIYVFFVGRSDDLMRDLLQHKTSPASDCVKSYTSTRECFYRYAPIEKGELREIAFRQICKFYQPSCNDPVTVADDNFQVNVT